MPFRTIELTTPAELHIIANQLTIIQENDTFSIPIEDIYQITSIGPDIRLSTMDLSILAENKISLMTLDDKYLPTAMLLPFSGNSRQAQLMHMQVDYPKEKYREIWMEVVRKKIANQSRNLALLGLKGSEEIAIYSQNINSDNVNYIEAMAAKEYFNYYHEGLNRRSTDPVNSRLNYGYAVVRSAIARALVITGFHPSFGIHHDNQLNDFNLADDLIEPYRGIVDQMVFYNIGTNELLNKSERKNIASILFHACSIDGIKMNVITSIGLMCESLKRIVLKNSNETLKLPTILKLELLEDITE